MLLGMVIVVITSHVVSMEQPGNINTCNPFRWNTKFFRLSFQILYINLWAYCNLNLREASHSFLDGFKLFVSKWKPRGRFMLFFSSSEYRTSRFWVQSIALSYIKISRFLFWIIVEERSGNFHFLTNYLKCHFYVI